MGLMQRLELRQGQSLVMTPQLLQAIKLLQLSHLDLVAYVDAELERNPLLEEAGEARDGPVSEPDGDREAAAAEDRVDTAELRLSDDLGLRQSDIEADFGTSLDNDFSEDGPGRGSTSGAGDAVALTPLSAARSSSSGSFEGEDFDFQATLSAKPSLHEHLQSQLDLATTCPVERLTGRHLIDAVDEAGYLGESCAAIAERLGLETAFVDRVLARIHDFSPSGIAARSLAECLALQLRERDRLDPAMQILLGHLDLVARRDFAALRRLCGVQDDDLADMIAELRQLDPKPGRAFGDSPVQVLVPDVFVRVAPDGSWLIELNPDTLPRVLVNQTYYATVSRVARSDSDKTFLTECLQSANWLTRSLEQRSRTILKVATEIVRQQDGFFAHGVSQLRPLNLKTVADAIGMHESTVSRVTSNKAIGTARGTFEMKYFFTAAIPGSAGTAAHSAEAVRHRIRQMIEGERGGGVLSDDALVRALKGEGIDIARRTVAKYRESLRIPSSIDRRREKLAMTAGAPA